MGNLAVWLTVTATTWTVIAGIWTWRLRGKVTREGMPDWRGHPGAAVNNARGPTIEREPPVPRLDRNVLRCSAEGER